ncbi:MAG: hypothetical protein QOF83_4260 [Solirubrobacteraceae bacterium]|jgi:hypothetical protein|nr:hypothetical protein [Solirubrobacteraceae bacterium]
MPATRTPITRADPPTETEISDPRSAARCSPAFPPRRVGRDALALAITALGLTAAGCGAAASGPSRTSVPTGPGPTSAASTTATQPADQFAWVRPGRRPPGWRVARIPTGASIAYPPGWTPAQSDRGTATAVLTAPGGRLIGYLNLTPRSGNEPLGRWARFRIAHNGEEHDTHVRALAAHRGLRFTTGTGSCVRDSYTTKTSANYIEIACLVVGRHRGVVAVGAAPPVDWRRLAPQLQRAVNSVRT